MSHVQEIPVSHVQVTPATAYRVLATAMLHTITLTATISRAPIPRLDPTIITTVYLVLLRLVPNAQILAKLVSVGNSRVNSGCHKLHGRTKKLPADPAAEVKYTRTLWLGREILNTEKGWVVKLGTPKDSNTRYWMKLNNLSCRFNATPLPSTL